MAHGLIHGSDSGAPPPGAAPPGDPIQSDSGGEPVGVGPPPGGLSNEEKALLRSLTNILDIQAEHLQNTTDFFAAVAPSYRDLFLAQNAYNIDSANTMRGALPQAFAAISDLYVRELGALATPGETERLATEVTNRALRGDAPVSELERVSTGYMERYLRGETATDLERQATENTQKYLRGETLLTGQDLSRMDTIFGRVREQGVQDITRFGQEQAAARGLRLTDTPIGATAQEQISDLTQGLGAARAESELGLERERFSSSEAVRRGEQAEQAGRFASAGAALTGERAAAQNRFANAEAVRQFQTNLRAAATSNRAAIAAGFIPGFKGGGGGAGGSLPTVGGGGADTGGAFSYLSGAAGQRNANAQAALDREFRASEGAANRGSTEGIARENRESNRPRALDYVGIAAGLIGRGLSAWG